ncbi:50S ribosomal protein L25 [Candidatus Moduliflexus flocculans]|uniref:Large ribosomal subunit protein bL25 n=1 Tax=Candidatus Moduliflexus flocculans TaxID=1499966 RepID=A0A0S6VYN6_9BACT|nr:50S ribosomal protein L25 [Candidatus Moduliflexus flocculans]
MEQVRLASQIRTTNGKGAARQLRRAGQIPAVMYGGKHGNLSLMLSSHDLRLLISKGIGSHLIDLEIAREGSTEKVPVILKEYQLDPVKRSLLHADFFEVTMDQAIEIQVPIELIGTAPGIKAGGVIEFATRELSIECLPGDILDKVEVDISALEIGSAITVRDIKLSEKYRVLTDEEVVVVTIAAPLTEADLETSQEGPAEPEVIQKGKKLEEE